MKSRFFGLGAKLALGLAVVMGTMTSCYEKEDIKTVIDTTPMTVTYTISGSVYNYSNLDAIGNATLVLTDAAGKEVGRATSDPVNGGYSITLKGLNESNRGNYTLAISADGYKDRSTAISIWFEKAENQSIATQMDFALKSNDIQGGVVEVVVTPDQESKVTIVGADGNGNRVEDEIVIPAGALTEAQTLTFERADNAEESMADAVRVYTGEPSGLVFEKPIEITFAAPELNGADLHVYYEEGGVWVLAEGYPNVTYNGDGTYTAYIEHFSRFKFAEDAYVVNVATADTVAGQPALEQEYIEHACHTTDTITVKLTANVYTGYRFAEDLNTTFANCSAQAKELAIAKVNDHINSEFSATNVTTEFTKKDVELTKLIEEYQNVTGFTIDYVTETINLAVTVEGTTYTVALQHVVNQELQDDGVGYDHTHGHGHGEDLNAGGGIIDFE